MTNLPWPRIRKPPSPSARKLTLRRSAIITGRVVGVLLLVAFLYSETVTIYVAIASPGTGEGVQVHPQAYLIHGRETPIGFREIQPSGPWVASSDYHNSGGGCTRSRTVFRDRQRYEITIEITGCQPINYANDFQWLIADRAKKQRDELAPGPLPMSTSVVTASPGAGRWRVIYFRNGQYVAVIAGRLPQSRIDAAAIVQLAKVQRSLLPGTPESAEQPLVISYSKVGSIVLGYLCSIYLIWTIVAFLRNAVRGLRSTSGEPRSVADVAWTNVAKRSFVMSVRARIRSWLRFLSLVFLIAATESRNHPAVSVAWVAAAAGVLLIASLTRPVGRIAAWSAAHRREIQLTRRFWLVLPIASLSAVLYLGAFAALVAVILLEILHNSGAFQENGFLNVQVAAVTPAFSGITVIPYDTLLAVAQVSILANLLVAGWLYRQARRLGQRDANEVMKKSKRPSIIILRMFGDDHLKIRTGAFTPRPWFDRLGLAQFVRFEEIVARYLWRHGEVFAVESPLQRYRLFGAARTRVPKGQRWEDYVWDKIDTSALIVVFAAPQHRTEGLSFELSMIHAEGALNKTLFVLPPFHREQMASRWQTFLSMASWFPGSPVAPWVDQVLVMTCGDGKVTCWHAKHRREYAYAIALDEAARSILVTSPLGHVIPAGDEERDHH